MRLRDIAVGRDYAWFMNNPPAFGEAFPRPSDGPLDRWGPIYRVKLVELGIQREYQPEIPLIRVKLFYEGSWASRCDHSSHLNLIMRWATWETEVQLANAERVYRERRERETLHGRPRRRRWRGSANDAEAMLNLFEE